MAMEEDSEYAAVNRLVGSISYVVIWAAGVFIALSILDLSGFVATLLAGVGIIGLALPASISSSVSSSAARSDWARGQRPSPLSRREISSGASASSR